MRRTLNFLTILAALLLGGTALASEVEPLHAVLLDVETLQLDVTTTGCTSEADFTILLQGHGRRAFVTAIRLQPDPCDGEPAVVRLVFDRAAIGLGDVESIRVRNPLRAFGPSGERGPGKAGRKE